MDRREAVPGRAVVREPPPLAFDAPPAADRRACDFARALADFPSPPRAVVFGVDVLLPLPPPPPARFAKSGPTSAGLELVARKIILLPPSLGKATRVATVVAQRDLRKKVEAPAFPVRVPRAFRCR